MIFSVLTLFPEMFSALLVGGIVKRSVESRRVTVEPVDIRAFTNDRHRTVDDRPFGGGCGMVMKPEPLAAAIRATKARIQEAPTVLLTPQGRPFDQDLARELAALPGLILVCGRYEGVDERIREGLIDDEISIGDFVLTGGELAAMVVIDAVSRLLPGALGNEQSALEDSFATGLLEHPHYTRPRVFEGRQAPEVLLSGDHGAIDQWRRRASLMRTLLRRPDLLSKRSLKEDDLEMLRQVQEDIQRILHEYSAVS